MKRKEAIVEALRMHGNRITRVRKEMIEILFVAKRPLSADEIRQELEKKKLKVDKTTVYRELDFFHENGISRKVDLGDQIRRYEITVDHHHHVICTVCKKVQDIILHHDVDAEARKIANEKGFNIFNHSLEFFGLCANCK